MAKTFSFKVVTPDGVAVRTETEGLVLPGAAGSLGVLAAHESWTVLLKKGAVSWKTPAGTWDHLDIGGGVAAIEPAGTTVLADASRGP